MILVLTKKSKFQLTGSYIMICAPAVLNVYPKISIQLERVENNVVSKHNNNNMIIVQKLWANYLCIHISQSLPQIFNSIVQFITKQKVYGKIEKIGGEKDSKQEKKAITKILKKKRKI